MVSGYAKPSNQARIGSPPKLIPVSYLGITDSRIAVFQHRHLQLASQGKAGWDKLEVQRAKILSLISAWFNHEEIF